MVINHHDHGLCPIFNGYAFEYNHIRLVYMKENELPPITMGENGHYFKEMGMRWKWE